MREFGVRPPEMILVSGGTFLMGSPISDATSAEYHADERPQRTIRVDDFYMSRFLVTAEDFSLFLNERGEQGYGAFGPSSVWATIEFADGEYRPRRGAERCPAIQVNWVGAVAYCEWLSERTGQCYRLPTEEEWEYAARGPDLRAWPWGDDEPLTHRTMTRSQHRQTPFYDFYGNRWMHKPWDEVRQWIKAPVGAFPKNCTPDGIYDMLGYWPGQWCSDEYIGPANEKPSEGEEKVPRRVIRGATFKQTNMDGIAHLKEHALVGLRYFVARRLIGDVHEGCSWTRTAGDERESYALVRLAERVGDQNDDSPHRE